MNEYSPAEKDALDKILPNWGQEEKPIDAITLQELESMTQTAFSLKQEREELERKVEKNKEIFNALQRKIQDVLTFHNKTDYRSESGIVDIRKKLSFKVPKTEEQKKDLFGWLKYKGIFWQYASVNSNSLNSLLKDFWDPVEKKFKEPISGVEAPVEYEQIYFTKR